MEREIAIEKEREREIGGVEGGGGMLTTQHDVSSGTPDQKMSLLRIRTGNCVFTRNLPYMSSTEHKTEGGDSTSVSWNRSDLLQSSMTQATARCYRSITAGTNCSLLPLVPIVYSYSSKFIFQ